LANHKRSFAFLPRTPSVQQVDSVNVDHIGGLVMVQSQGVGRDSEPGDGRCDGRRHRRGNQALAPYPRETLGQLERKRHRSISPKEKAAKRDPEVDSLAARRT